MGKHGAAGWYDGYTLYNGLDETEIYLIDMEGRVVHSWDSEGSCLGELLPNGDLFYGRNQHGVYRLDWDGRRTWAYDCDFHHDFDISLERKVTILAGYHAKVLNRPDIFAGCSDGLAFIGNMFLEVDLETLAVTRIWHAHEHLEELKAIGIAFPRPVDERSKNAKGDIFHCNTLEVLPDTAIGRSDVRFRKGNLLFSYRQMSTIGVVDRDTGEIVWAWGPGELDGQHQPTMIPDRHPITGELMPGAGHILVFDNGRYDRNYSRVIEVEPASGEIVWSSPTNWHSWHISGAERLPNGNTLICDGPAGRIFEITADGETVWEYQNPFSSASSIRKRERKRERDELGLPGFEDIGGHDTEFAVYRAMRYPKAYVDQILEEHGR